MELEIKTLKTKIVDTLPLQLEASTQYLVKHDEKFDMYVTDDNGNIRQLQIDVNKNLMKQSNIFMELVSVGGRNGSFMVTRLWDEPSIYGMWSGLERQSNAVWGIQSNSRIPLNHHLFTEDLRNKEITVSVEVCAVEWDAIAGLNVGQEMDMPFHLKKGVWTRIHKTYTGTQLCGITAQMKNPSDTPPAQTFSYSNYLYYRYWKVEKGKVPTTWIQSEFDLSSDAVCYVKTHKLPNPARFSTSDPIETRYQDGIQVGLTATNVTINVVLNRYTFRCRYIFLYNNSQVTFTGINQIVTNAPDGGATLRGNRGDYVDFTYFQDQNNQMLMTAFVYRMNGEINNPLKLGNNIIKSDSNKIHIRNNTDNTNAPLVASGVELTNLQTVGGFPASSQIPTADGKSKYMSGGFKYALIDASGTADNKYCLIKIQQAVHSRDRFIIFNSLNSNKNNRKPSYATHNLGFSLYLDFEVTGGGYGTNSPNITVNEYSNLFCTVHPVANLNHKTENTTTYFYVRGGSIYHLFYHCLNTSQGDYNVQVINDIASGANFELYQDFFVPKEITEQQANIIPYPTGYAKTFANRITGDITLHMGLSTFHNFTSSTFFVTNQATINCN